MPIENFECTPQYFRYQITLSEYIFMVDIQIMLFLILLFTASMIPMIISVELWRNVVCCSSVCLEQCGNGSLRKPSAYESRLLANIDIEFVYYRHLKPSRNNMAVARHFKFNCRTFNILREVKSVYYRSNMTYNDQKFDYYYFYFICTITFQEKWYFTILILYYCKSCPYVYDIKFTAF